MPLQPHASHSWNLITRCALISQCGFGREGIKTHWQSSNVKEARAEQSCAEQTRDEGIKKHGISISEFC